MLNKTETTLVRRMLRRIGEIDKVADILDISRALVAEESNKMDLGDISTRTLTSAPKNCTTLLLESHKGRTQRHTH